MPALLFCNCLVGTKHDGFEKRLCPSAKISNTVSCNILYCVPKMCIVTSLVYMYVYMYHVCMNVCMYVCMYVRMYVRTYVRMYVCMYV